MAFATWTRRTGTIAAAALAVASGAWLPAQEQQRIEVKPLRLRVVEGSPQQEVVIQAITQAEAKSSEYWIGLSCAEVSAALRSHLGLSPESGIIVEQVLDDSPAAKAGLQEHDVLIKAGDKTLSSVGVLIEAVDAAKDKELAIELIRGGKTISIKVTPQKRPSSAAAGAEEKARIAVKKWLGQIHPEAGQHDQFEFRILQPGAVLPHGQPLPKDLSISITRTGNEPAKIIVKKGDQKWEVAEDKLSELPDDVRPHVERMMGRGPRVFAMPHIQGLPGQPAIPQPQVRALERLNELRLKSDGGEGVAKQLREVQEQVEKLTKQLEALQKQLPKPE